MRFIESAIYFVVFVGLCVVALWYGLGGLAAQHPMVAPWCVAGAIHLVAWVVLRALWVETKPRREFKKILKEIRHNRGQ